MVLVSAAVSMVLRMGARPLATTGCASSPRGLAEVHRVLLFTGKLLVPDGVSSKLWYYE